MPEELSFGRWLQQRRRALDLTQAELARWVGCATVTIHKIESEQRRPSKEIAERLAEMLQVPAEERAAFLAFARGESSTHVPTLPTRVAPPVPDLQRQDSTTNLPLPATPLIGREREVADVRELLSRPDIRILTLTGTGGIGKTRLALEVAARIRETFVDGVCFVALAPIRDPALVLPTIAQALGVKESSSQPLLESLIVSLREQHRLLLLDNFEQVVAAAPHIAELLTGAPRIKILITSRTPLHLSSEQEFPVPPLPLPDHQHQAALPIAALLHSPAVALFVQRTRAVKPDFGLTDENGQAIAEICTRLDGLPLAIELAAARTKLLPPQALLARLGSRLHLLTGGKVDQDPRHQTLRATIDWSYQVLTAAEQQLFARLAVFAGGWTLEAVEAVCNADAALSLDLLDGLASLLDKSLIQQVTGIGDDVRFTMLETIREYALEQLEASGEAEALQQAHATYYLALAEQAEPLLRGLHQRFWLDRLESEHDNLRAALQWALAGGDRELGLRFVGALVWFWPRCDYYSEQQRYLEHAVAVARDSTVPRGAPLAKVLVAAAGIIDPMGDSARREALYGESLALYQALGDKSGAALVLVAWGRSARAQGDYARATKLEEEGLALYREVGDQWGTAFALLSLGDGALDQAELSTARAWYQEALMLFREAGDHILVGWALLGLGRIAHSEDDDQQATVWLEESQAVFREVGLQAGVAYVLTNLGHIARKQGDGLRAIALYRESLALAQRLDVYRFSIADCLEGVAAASVAIGSLQQATRLFGAADVLRDALGTPLSAAAQGEYERDIAKARADLGEAAFAAAWAEGRAMPLDQAIAYALTDDTESRAVGQQ